MDEKYQGWANRETWAAHLWLTNDEKLYERAQEFAADLGHDWTPDYSIPAWPDECAVCGVKVSEHGESVDTRVREWFEALVEDLWDTYGEAYGLNPSPADSARSAISDIGSVWRIDWAGLADALRELGK